MKPSKLLKTLTLATLAMGLFTTGASAQNCNVSKGDSMWSIAKRYKVDFSDILNANKHFKDQDLIHPNQKIEFPEHSAHAHANGAGTQEDSGNDSIDKGTERAEETTSDTALAILRLVNAERKKQGLDELAISHTLNGVAQKKAEDMRDNNYFSHDSPTYGSPFEMMQRFGVDYRSAGENIASGQRSANEVMIDWMNSSGHRANILGDYEELGVGYATGGEHGTYWVQQFISK